MARDWIALLIFFGICFAVGASGSLFTASSVKTWYPGLLKPAGTPPPWIFGPVWSILYLLMAAAAWIVWRQRVHEDVWLALALFMAQLILNGLWSLVFFGLRRPGAALVEIIVLLAAISVTAMRFAEFSRPAFWLMTPYGAWVLYASYLNFGIWRLNKGTAGLWWPLGFTALPGGVTICLDVGLGKVPMSPPRDSQGSTKIARQTPIDRVSQKTRIPAIPRRASTNSREFDAQAFLATIGKGRKAMLFPKKHTIFTQGDPADAVFYLQTGKVRLTVVSKTGKEATIGILSDGSFFGEGSLAGQSLRMGTATAMTDCAVLRIEKKAMMQALHREHKFSDLFVAYLLARNIRYEEDLVDQLFNSSEKRLARVLLMLAHFGKDGAAETVVPKISQETLAEMIGTTRSRVSFFMNRFRKMGFVDYNGGGFQVHSSLLNVVLHD